MQIRKLIRLLQEAQEKVGPYAHVTVDTKTYEKWLMDWQYDSISTVDIQSMMHMNRDGYSPENGQEQQTIVLNGY